MNFKTIRIGHTTKEPGRCRKFCSSERLPIQETQTAEAGKSLYSAFEKNIITEK